MNREVFGGRMYLAIIKQKLQPSGPLTQAITGRSPARCVHTYAPHGHTHSDTHAHAARHDATAASCKKENIYLLYIFFYYIYISFFPPGL